MNNQFSTQENSDSVISVSSLNRMARSLLESNFPAVVVEGEISNLAVPSSGHWYLTLKDKSSQIRCAMFRGNNMRVKFKPANGNQVVIRGRLSIYEGRGDYQLIADSMEEAGDGALRRAFELLKAKLNDEGLFEEKAKQTILGQYRHIAVITSATGAAFHDILSVFARRFPATQLTLIPVTVQGANAPDEIVAAIELANRHSSKLGIEALIVGRGGGSLEDLQAFNEESVARAIFNSALPITSAVGHEIDFTIADFVADLRAPTPSAAAEQMSPDQHDYFQMLAAFNAQLHNRIRSQLSKAGQELLLLSKQLIHPDRRLLEQAQNLDRLESRMNLAVSNSLSSNRSELKQLQRSLLANSPSAQLKQSGIQINNALQSLKQATAAYFNKQQATLTELGRSLNAVSPLNTLARGYSITTDETAKVIIGSDDVKVGSKITSRLKQGSITSIVESTSKETK